MSKAMCKVSDKKYELLLTEKKHKYQCKKCGRISHKEERICKPERMEKSAEATPDSTVN